MNMLIKILIAAFLMPISAMAEPLEITVTPIPLYADNPDRITVGALTYKGGLHLRASDPRFGGFSGLGVSADGARIVSVSDRGMSLSAKLSYDGRGNLNGLTDTDLGALADLNGESLVGKRWSDAESMSPGVEGEIIVAFERDHRLWRYDPGATNARALRPPDELAGLSGNAGIEALTLLNDGRLFAIAEGSTDEDGSVAWVSKPDGWEVLIYITGNGFRPTGAATLPNGDVLVLERFYTPRAGVRIRIKHVTARAIFAGAEVTGEIIADLRPPMSIDNFEGIDVRQGRDGETLVYLISDDNFNDDQRTLLLMFALGG